jgi:hypothetical protein
MRSFSQKGQNQTLVKWSMGEDGLVRGGLSDPVSDECDGDEVVEVVATFTVDQMRNLCAWWASVDPGERTWMT